MIEFNIDIGRIDMEREALVLEAGFPTYEEEALEAHQRLYDTSTLDEHQLRLLEEMREWDWVAMGGHAV